MTRTERLLRLAKLRGDRAAELIIQGRQRPASGSVIAARLIVAVPTSWTEAELRAAWGDR